MTTCDVCGLVAKTPQGLSAHRRWKHPAPFGPVGRMARAVETTLTELDRIGRIEIVDTARVELVRALAEACDQKPHDARLWRELRDAIKELADADDRADGDLAAALASIGSGAALGDASTS